MPDITKQHPPLPELLLAEEQRLSVPRRGHVFRIGDKVEYLYLVNAGQVYLQHLNPTGNVVVLQRIGPGEFLAECSLSMSTYGFDAKCPADTELRRFPVRQFRDALYSDGHFAAEWAMYLSDQLRAKFARIELHNIKNARDRILRYLIEMADPAGGVALRGSLRALAAELGIAHEVLYRTLAQLEREKQIFRSEGNIQVL
ncbi:MAG: Crp/Fnr family transcriptional regulator [Xanthomonadaceae bacterium]|nr:Crp/Fnr family transcriptional regulator [Xanthomonadaceae bacterium]